MRRMMAVWLLALLLPACTLAVTEGVVEEAPPVAIPVPQMTDALFGAWEQGLSDIRLAARRAAMDWADFPADMKLEFLRMDNFPVDEDADNDEILVRFIYRDEENRERRVLVRYLRGTGALVWLSDTMTNIQRHAGEPLEDALLLEIAGERLKTRYHVQAFSLRQADDGMDAEHWMARFDSPQGLYEVVLDRKNGDVLRVSLNVGDQGE